MIRLGQMYSLVDQVLTHGQSVTDVTSLHLENDTSVYHRHLSCLLVPDGGTFAIIYSQFLVNLKFKFNI